MRVDKFFLLVVLSLFFSACNLSDPYSSYKIIKGSKWDRNGLLEFKIDSASVFAAEKYDVLLGIVNSSRYPYQNIWLQIEQNFKDTLFVNDTVEIKLTDEKGNWLGSGTGGLYQYTVPYKTGVKLDSVRNYTLQISQVMMDDPLVGIDKIGVMIVAAGE